MMDAEGYARHLAQFEQMTADLAATRAIAAEREALLAAREMRIDELEADRAKLLAERDHAMARLMEIETQFRSFGALVVDALQRRERRPMMPELVIAGALAAEPDGGQAAA